MTSDTSPLFALKAYGEPSLFQADNLLREGRRQRHLPDEPVPEICLLDPDGDVVRHLRRSRSAALHKGWADLAGAGLLLMSPSGGIEVAAASDHNMELLDGVEVLHDEGPCADCLRSGEPVMSDDLRLEAARWPRYAAEAITAGYAAVAAVPLRLRGQIIGAMNLLRNETGAPGPRDLIAAQALADVATIGLLQQRASEERRLLAEQLQHALDSRIVVEQAKGVLAAGTGLDVDVDERSRRSASTRGTETSASRKSPTHWSPARSRPVWWSTGSSDDSVGRAAHQLVMTSQRLLHRVGMFFPQACRTLEIREQERDRPRRRLRHQTPPPTRPVRQVNQAIETTVTPPAQHTMHRPPVSSPPPKVGEYWSSRNLCACPAFTERSREVACATGTRVTESQQDEMTGNGT